MEIERSLWEDLRSHLEAPEISLLIGPRQAGKTTLLKAIQAEVQHDGRPVLFFNLDVQADERHFSSQERLLHRIQLETGSQPADRQAIHQKRILRPGLLSGPDADAKA